MKGYKEAHAKAREYMRAERAGWVKPGKRTTENHAILIPRREAVEMAGTGGGRLRGANDQETVFPGGKV